MTIGKSIDLSMPAQQFFTKERAESANVDKAYASRAAKFIGNEIIQRRLDAPPEYTPRTLQEVTSMTEAEVLRSISIGKKTLEAAKKMLKTANLSFAAG